MESCYGRNSYQTTIKHDNKEREWFELHADSDDMEFLNEESSKSQKVGGGRRRKDPKNIMPECKLIRFLVSQNCSLSFSDDLIAFLKHKVKGPATIKMLVVRERKLLSCEMTARNRRSRKILNQY